MDTIITCPLGSECEEAKNGKLYRCRWYVELAGQDAQGKDANQWNCAISWNVQLQLETSANVRGTNMSIQSLRNEQVVGHEQFMALATNKVKELN